MAKWKHLILTKGMEKSTKAKELKARNQYSAESVSQEIPCYLELYMVNDNFLRGKSGPHFLLEVRLRAIDIQPFHCHICHMTNTFYVLLGH